MSIKFMHLNTMVLRTFQLEEIAVGANAKDSVQGCHMVWLLKGENGRNILVDAGWIDTSKTDIENGTYVRPDLVLQKN